MLFGVFIFSGSNDSNVSVAFSPVVKIQRQCRSCERTSSNFTGSTMVRNLSEALPCSRIAVSAVEHSAMPFSRKNASILSGSKRFSFPTRK
ncbi:hypothetical protein KZ360_05540 [Glaesserella parasuis]|nr:hypothetical protein [Glaesserella parasuis]